MKKLTLHEKDIILTVLLTYWRYIQVSPTMLDKAFESLTGKKLSYDKYKGIDTHIRVHFFSFLHSEPDEIIVPVVVEFFEMAQAFFERNPRSISSITSEYGEVERLVERMKEYRRLKEKEIAKSNFFENIDIDELQLDATMAFIVKQRIQEIKLCLHNAPLATILLCGSVLEGVLLDVAQKNPQNFNQANCAPKNREEKVLQFSAWSLAQFIDVASELGYLQHDMKKFSHVLRDFRNYIHPNQQKNEDFTPNEQTAKLCCQALEGALNSIANFSKGSI